MSPAIRPFLVPDPSRFHVDDWSLTSPILGSFAEGIVEGWDPATSLSVTATLIADIAGALADCELDSGATIGCTLRWRSSRTGLRGTSATVQIQPGPNLITLDLAGERLGGTLAVQCVVHLVSRNAGSQLSPLLPGSLLWDDSHSWLLEGIGARFPVEILDFQKAGMRGPGAAWAVYWYHRDPDGPASSAFRLRLNSRHALVTQFVVGQPATFEHDNLATVLRRDVVRELVNAALDIDEDLEDREWPPDSLGGVLLGVLGMSFPGLDREEIRGIRENYPADFESALQTLTGFLSVAGTA